MYKHILAIDQGTSGSRAFIYRLEGKVLELIASGSAILQSYYPQSSYVEQNAGEILDSVNQAVHRCLKSAMIMPAEIDIAAISNQRETFVLWDEGGKPLAPAIVWQCRRSTDICKEWGDWDAEIRKRTGLRVDPYFSASKLVKLLRENSQVAEALKEQRCYFGTIDSWLLYQLTGNYCCDSTNASRTMFFNIHNLSWDWELLHHYHLENLHLPEVHPSASFYGQSDFWGLLPKQVPIHSAIGDSHGAAVGHGCLELGFLKATLGTGSSVLLHVGQSCPSNSFQNPKGIQTLCFSTETQTHYASEGIIISFGASVSWLRDSLKLFRDFTEAEAIGLQNESDGVVLLPAFSGLGAPFWKSEAKGAIQGLTLASRPEQIIRAAYESLAFQLYAMITDMQQYLDCPLKQLSFDGGLVTNHFLMQYIAELFGLEVSVPSTSMAARGTTLLACHHAFATPLNLPDKRQIFVPKEKHRDRYLQKYRNWCSYIDKL